MNNGQPVYLYPPCNDDEACNWGYRTYKDEPIVGACNNKYEQGSYDWQKKRQECNQGRFFRCYELTQKYNECVGYQNYNNLLGNPSS